jgi:hypothetical protein
MTSDPISPRINAEFGEYAHSRGFTSAKHGGAPEAIEVLA